MMVFDVAKHLGEIQTFDGYISSGVDLSWLFFIGVTGKELNHLGEVGTSACLWLGCRKKKPSWDQKCEGDCDEPLVRETDVCEDVSN